MKKQKLTQKLLLGLITLSLLSTAQTGMDYQFIPFGSYSHLRSGFSLFQQNQNNEKALGVFQSNFTPQSFLEVNSLPTYMPFPMPGLALGEVFRTTSPNNLNSTWRLFAGTGLTAEKFNINVPATTNNVELSAVQNGRMLFNTNGFTRMFIDNGGAGNNAGQAAFGNNLPANFVPTSRLHLHQTGGVVTMRFSNTTTGSTANNGFEMGIAGNGDAFFINNTLNQNFSWYNQGGGGPGTLLGRMRLFDGGVGQTTGRLAISNDLPGAFVPIDRVHLYENATTGFNGVRLSSINTGQTTTDGFQMAINNNNGTVVNNQNEQAPILWQLPNAGNVLTEYMRIQNTTGFVGVNTNAPTRQLDVNGKVRVQDLLSNGPNAAIVTNFADGTLQNLAFTGNPAQYLAGNGTWVTLPTGGGANICGTALVNNVMKFTGANTLCNTNITDLAPANFVGINNTAPNDALDVSNGNIDVVTPTNAYKIGNQSFLWHKGGNTNVFLGLNAGFTHVVNAPKDNIFIGHNAAYNFLPTLPSVGDRNVVIGSDAAYNMLGGEQTVVIGDSAGYNSNTSGKVFIGHGAGFNHGTSGGSSCLATFVGYRSGFKSNNPCDVTFVGAYSGEQNTTGDANSFFGTACGRNNTTGGNNSFFGTIAGVSNGIHNLNSGFGLATATQLKGDSNVVIGALSAQAVTQSNAVLGTNSMASANSGIANTIIGNNTYKNATSGLNNVVVGYNSAANFANASNITIIGGGADATNINSNLNNASAIGFNARVTNNNHMILGNNNVNVGIGLSADPIGPQNKLEINRTSGISPVSGLRLRDLAGAVPLASNNQVLSVNPLNGDVILTTAPTGGTTLGGLCPNITNPLPGNWEIPLANNNFIFGGQGNTNNNVGIGTNCTPQAKLEILQNSGNFATTGLLVTNLDAANPLGGTSVIGIKSLVPNLSNNCIPLAGWFETGSVNATCNGLALYVPQGGGYVGIGYPTTTAAWNSGGLLNVNGSIQAAAINYPSDATLKNTVITIPNALQKIKSLRPVTYKWNTALDSGMAGTHAGFIAQEVDTVIPHIVKTNAYTNKKSVAYTEIIPYLVKGMQQQQRQIEKQDSVINVLSSLLTSLTNSINACCNNNSISKTGVTGNNINQLNISLSDADVIVLNQNVPNPFAEQTTITYNVPAKYGFAQMVFKTLDGKIIKTVDITTKGKGQMNVFASDLSNGLYMYSLIVDGKLIDSKKMVKE